MVWKPFWISVFETLNFNFVIGQPWSKFLPEGSTKGQLYVRFGRKEYSIPITRAINAIAEQPPDPDPLEQAIMGVSQETAQPNFEEDTQFFAQEEAEMNKPFHLDEFERPP
jgi:hypothetical protein